MIDYLGFLEALAYLAIIIVFMWLGKIIQDRLSPGIDHAVRENNSYMAALKRAGLLLAIAIGMMGPLTSGSLPSLKHDLLALAIEGLQVLLFILFATSITFRAIVGKLNMDPTVNRFHTSGALVYFGTATATGLIAFGCFTDLGGTWWNPLLFFAIGQLTLILAALVYEWASSWEVRHQIHEANVGAGLLLSGILIALGIILQGAISGPSRGLTNDLISFGSSAIFGILFFILLLLPLLNRLFLPGTTLQQEVEIDKTPAPVLLIVLSKIGLALVISVLI